MHQLQHNEKMVISICFASKSQVSIHPYILALSFTPQLTHKVTAWLSS